MEASQFSDVSGDEIRLFNDNNNQLKSKNSILGSVGRDSITRDSLLNELKLQNKEIKGVIKQREDYNGAAITDYDEKFHKNAEDDLMDVDVVNLTDLDTEFLLVEDERERKRKQRELEFDHRK